MAGPAILLILVVLFSWKLVLTNQFTWLEAPDLAYLVLPWFQFQAGEWHHGRFPLWDPNGWAGQPLFGQAQPGAAYPLNWLLFLMPLHNGWIRQISLHWYWVVIHWLAAVTCYALCRDLGRSRGPSIVAGCVFALGGYVANTDWPQMLNGAVWAPLVFLFLFRAERDHRPLTSALFSGLFLGITWLAGHHQVQIFLSIAAAATWAWLAFRGGRPDWRILRLAALSLAFAVMTSAFQTLPTAEYGRLARRWSGGEEPLRFNETVPYSVHQKYAIKPISLIGIVIPSIEHGANPFVGVAGFGLGLLGLVLAWRERQVRRLAALALGGILFALGPHSLLHGVIYSLVPLVEKARVPGAATLVFSVGLAPLVAYALDALPRPESYSVSRQASIIASAAGGILLIASLLFYATKVPLEISDDRLVLSGVFAIALASLLAGLRHGQVTPRAAVCCALALVLVELANQTGYWLPHVSEQNRNLYLKPMSQQADLVEFVRSQGGSGRVEVDSSAIPYNIGDWFGLETFESYTASVTQNVWQHDVFSPRVRNFFGIRYYFGKAPQRPDQRELYIGASGLKVFENPGAFPRAWSVHEGTTVAGEREARAMLADAAFDAKQKVFLVARRPPALEQCGAPDYVQLARHEPNRVVINARMSCRGMVILTDTWFPGWRATVDGKSAPIEEAYGVVRGVVVARGQHTIEMRYRPLSVFLGAALTAAAVLIALVFGLRQR